MSHLPKHVSKYRKQKPSGLTMYEWRQILGDPVRHLDEAAAASRKKAKPKSKTFKNLADTSATSKFREHRIDYIPIHFLTTKSTQHAEQEKMWIM